MFNEKKGRINIKSVQWESPELIKNIKKGHFVDTLCGEKCKKTINLDDFITLIQCNHDYKTIKEVLTDVIRLSKNGYEFETPEIEGSPDHPHFVKNDFGANTPNIPF